MGSPGLLTTSKCLLLHITSAGPTGFGALLKVIEKGQVGEVNSLLC